MISKGVLELSYEFIITLVIMIGGGYLIDHGVQVTIIVTFIGMCMTFWFSNRKLGALGNGQATTTDSQQAPAETTAAAPTASTTPVPTPFDVTKK
jgi:F0F1-type ATP synthase assembly protein I